MTDKTGTILLSKKSLRPQTHFNPCKAGKFSGGFAVEKFSPIFASVSRLGGMRAAKMQRQRRWR